MRQGSYVMKTVRLIGETEVVHRKGRRSHDFRGFFGQVRSVFGFLLVATVLVFIFSYREDVQNYVVSNLYRWSQAELKSSSIRQAAINHENEVNRVTE